MEAPNVSQRRLGPATGRRDQQHSEHEPSRIIAAVVRAAAGCPQTAREP